MTLNKFIPLAEEKKRGNTRDNTRKKQIKIFNFFVKFRVNSNLQNFIRESGDIFM